MGTQPSISVILSTMGSLESLEQTICRLVDQTICPEIELVLVGPAQDEPWWIAPLRNRLHGVQLVIIDSFVSIGESNAIGVRHAAAEIVALGEVEMDTKLQETYFVIDDMKILKAGSMFAIVEDQ